MSLMFCGHMKIALSTMSSLLNTAGYVVCNALVQCRTAVVYVLYNTARHGTARYSSVIVCGDML